MPKLIHDQILSEDKFHFTEEEREKVQEAWEVTKAILGKGELLSRYMRWASQRTPKYLSRPDLALHNSHQGYIYAIRDPRIKGEHSIIFVGSSPEPWIAIERHLKRSTNSKMRKYVKEMLQDLEKIGHVWWRKKEVAECWEDQQPLPPRTLDGATEIPWEILGYYQDPAAFQKELEKYDDWTDIEPNRSRNEWIELLLAEGHPLQNGLPGRKVAKKS